VQQRIAFGERAGQQVRLLRVTLAACGAHKCVRDVSRARRGGVSGRTGGFCPTRGVSRGVSRVRATGGRQAKSALKSLSA
jgi:hypothetical protein